MNQVLLLNASFEPLSIINYQRAARLIMRGRAEIEKGEPDKQLGPYVWPTVIRLKKYVNVPRKGAIWSRRGVFARDGYECAYCAKSLTYEDATIDHLVPRAKGGQNTWTNTATSCKACNNRKGNRSLEEAEVELGMHLREGYIPRHPRTNYVVLITHKHEHWVEYGI